jgi:hypothetical protein
MCWDCISAGFQPQITKNREEPRRNDNLSSIRQIWRGNLHLSWFILAWSSVSRSYAIWFRISSVFLRQIMGCAFTKRVLILQNENIINPLYADRKSCCNNYWISTMLTSTNKCPFLMFFSWSKYYVTIQFLRASISAVIWKYAWARKFPCPVILEDYFPLGIN